MSSRLLPVHGFVLAGGASTRMGTDKARIYFRGHPLIAIAAEKLGGLCAQTSIAGNRDDLAGYGSIVHESRLGAGPAAGIEAGLHAATWPWALFIPVDVPLVPADLLRLWVEETLDAGAEAGNGSFLVAAGEPQPTFCLLRSDCRDRWSDLVATGQRRLSVLLADVLAPRSPRSVERPVEHYSAAATADAATVRLWFSNVNTPQELARAEAAAGGAAVQALETS